MLTATSYGEICLSLQHYMSPSGLNQNVRLVGVLFCQPHSPFMKEEILPALQYFHVRSGNHTNFYFAGYYPDFTFNPQIFDNLRREFQEITKWRYSGGSDLILANARFDAANNSAYLDFSSALSVTFEQLDHDGGLLNLGIFFERIFKYGERCNGFDPTWGFSDSQGAAMIGSALKNLLISALPKPLQGNAKTAFHFISKDLSG